MVLCGSEWRKVGRVKGMPTAVTAITNCNAATIRRKGGTTADGRWRRHLLPRIGRCFGLGEVGGKCGATGGAVEVDGGR